ncbi:MAG TPA: GTP cyclohydrolase I FolE [Fimbriimonadaceae bacterium]|nr:GTP cyclohydrolase I FolE [Fimbriimonadaceae bacterium]
MIHHGRVVKAVRSLLVALDYDPSDAALVDTPERVARAWAEQLAGVNQKAEEILGATFDAARYDEIILLRDIPFHSTCEHHLLPFHGTADVAYVPKVTARVVGLSKLARLVDLHARRLQLQERMTQGIADDLARVIEPAGVAVVVRAQHLCMCARGVGKPGAVMVTSVMRGCFRDAPEARAELMSLLAM